MLVLLWAVVLVTIAVGLAERRRLHDRVELLEMRMASAEAASPRPAARAARRHPRESTEADAPIMRPGGAGTATGTPHAPTRRPAPRPAEEAAVEAIQEEAPLRLPPVNVPAVLGVLISLLGFSFLLKLALDHGWLDLPIETRHVLVAVVGVGFTVSGWRLRSRLVAFSRALLGGGLATLCLTIYSAVLVFHLVGGTLGFAALLGVVGLSGLLAAHLRSRTLAILGLVGGLSAPLLLPDGGVGLAEVLAYYSVFSAAALALSLRHGWSTFHLLSFVGTFGSAFLWAVDRRFFNPPAEWPVHLWIGVLFLLYLAIGVANVVLRGDAATTFVNRVLLVGSPSVALALSALVGASAEALALRCLGIGALYAAGAGLMQRRHQPAACIHTFVATAVALVALAIPLGLDGEQITLAWATGAALQTSLAMHRRRPGYAIAAVGLLFVTALYHFGQAVAHPVAAGATAYLHPTFISGAWVAVAALLSAWWIDRQGARCGLASSWPWIPFGIGIGTWVAANGSEILRVVDGSRRIGAFIVLFALTALIGDRTRWARFRRFLVVYAPALLWMLGLSAITLGHPLAGGGWLAWPLGLAVLAHVVRSQRAAAHDFGLWALHVVGLVVAGWELHYRLARVLEGCWPLALVTTVLAAWTALTVRRHGEEPVYRDWILVTAGGSLSLVLAGLQLGDGAAPPLPYVPLLNPIDLAAVASLLGLGMMLRLRGGSEAWGAGLGLASIGCLSMTALRTVHHFAGVAFTPLALWSSMTAQTALTVTWAAAGLATMVGGTWRARRGLWLAGATLMALVVAKLFVVDLSGVNTAARIVSFLGVGGLLLAVGYLAPAPPSVGDSAAVPAP